MKVTQKLIRDTEIRNLQINTDFYNGAEIDALVMAYFSFYLFDDSNDLRLSMEYVDRLEVAEKSGFLVNVAVLKDGTKVFVIL